MGTEEPIGGIAQSGERCFRKAEVGGSNPLPSTNQIRSCAGNSF